MRSVRRISTKRAFIFILVLLLAFTFCFSSLSLSEARSASLAELIRQEAKSEVWVEVEGQPYAIITLRHYIVPIEILLALTEQHT